MRTKVGLAVLVTVLAAGSLAVATSSSAAPQPAARATRGTTSTQSLVSAMEQAATGLAAPDDPRAVAESLVHTVVTSPDLTVATGALAELLRRSGHPIVSIDGSLIGYPDRAGYPDAMVEIELLRGVAQHLRAGSEFAFPDVAEVFPALGITTGTPTWANLTFFLASYGKGDVPEFVATAGAAIRALAAERGVLLDPYAPEPEQWLDPVQMILITTQLGLQPSLRADATSFGPQRTPRGSALQACARLADGFKNIDAGPDAWKALVEALKTSFDGLEEVLGDELDKAAEKGILTGWLKSSLDGLGFLKDTFSKAKLAAKYVSLLLLVDGTRLRVYGDDRTHYKHVDGESKRNVRVVADVSFRQEFDKAEVSCFNLAGFEIPPDGPMPDQTIEWSFDQEYRLTTGGRSPAHLVPAERANRLREALTSKTNGDGLTSLLLTPPVENFPGEGAEHRANVKVKAQLKRDDADWEVGDFLGILKGCALGGPAGCTGGAVSTLKDAGVRKLTELGLNAVLPSAVHNVEVAYHGAEPLVVKGRVENYFALAYSINSVEVDLVSCNERSGPWIGSATFGGTSIEFFGEMVQGSGLWNASSLPDYTSPITNSNLSLDLPDPNKPPVWELIKGRGGPLVRAQMRLLPEGDDWSKTAVMPNRSLGSPVGKLNIGIAEIPNWFGTDLSFTVYRVKSDPRCGGEPPFHWER